MLLFKFIRRRRRIWWFDLSAEQMQINWFMSSGTRRQSCLINVKTEMRCFMLQTPAFWHSKCVATQHPTGAASFSKSSRQDPTSRRAQLSPAHARFLHTYPFISQQNPKGSRKWGNRERWDASHQEVKCKQPLRGCQHREKRKQLEWRKRNRGRDNKWKRGYKTNYSAFFFFFLLSSVFFCPQAPSDKFSEFSIREAAARWRRLSLYQTDRQEVNAAWQDLTIKKKKHTEKNVNRLFFFKLILREEVHATPKSLLEMEWWRGAV